MKKKPDILPKTELRRLAKARLGKRKKIDQPLDQADTLRLIHELQVRQIELEMQNKELAQARADAEEAYRQYTDLYDFAPVGYFNLTRNGTILEVNLAGANLLGVERTKLINRRLGLFVSRESRSVFSTFLEKLLSCEGKEICELAFGKKKDGVLWARVEATCFEGGEVCRAALTDITERKRMELTLQESEKRFRMLLQDVPSIAVQGYALDGTIQYWNSASENLYGYSAKEAIGQDLLKSIIPPEMRDEVRQAIKQLGESGRPIPAAELSLMRKDGSRVSVYSSHAIVSIPGHAPELFCLDVDLTERKLAEEALKDSEWRNRIVSELTTDYIFVVDVDPGGKLKLRWASDNMFRITGRTLEEVESFDSWGSVIHPEDRECFFAFINQILSTAKEHELECRALYKKHAGERWIRISARPQVNDAKVITTIIGAIKDITESKQAEEQLQESEKRFRNLVETTSDWIWEIDANGIYTYASPRICDILGFESSETIGKRPEDFMPPEEAQRVLGIITSIFAERSPFANLENKNLHKDGRVIILETSGVPIVDHDGLFCGYRGIDRDITERKHAEEALRESQEKFQAIADYTVDWESWFGLDGKYLWVNPGVEEITGYSAKEVLAMPDFISILVMDEDRNAFIEHFQAAIRGSRGKNFEFRYLHKNGTRRWLSISWRPIYDAKGNPLGTRASGRDITERKLMETELQLARESLTTTNIELKTALTRQQQLAHTDVLTGINNRRYLYELAEHKFEVATRYRQPLSVMMFDLDHFKQVNDTFGHMAGDQILQLVTQVAKEELRSADVLGRYGGEEFVIVLPMTNAQQACSLAERIRKRVATTRLPTEKGDATVTLSIGIVEIRHDAETESAEDMIRRADEAMYAAKQAGRNQTKIGES